MAYFTNTKTLNAYFQLRIKHLKSVNVLTPDKKLIYLPYKKAGESLNQAVKITTTPCNYGGHRYWFLCPKCDKRVSVLYRNGIFVCRHCIGASYKSQLQQADERVFARLNQLRDKLGWQGGIIHGYGGRPKGMHQKTFKRLVAEYLALEQVVSQNINLRLNMIDRQFNKVAKDMQNTLNNFFILK